MAKKISSYCPPETTASDGSKKMRKDPADAVDLAAIPSPNLETVILKYKDNGEKDVRVAHNHRADPPLGAPKRMLHALRRLEANASPEECSFVAHVEEAYEAYLDGFYDGMDTFYRSVKFTVPAWAEYPLERLERESKFLSLDELMAFIRKPKPTARKIEATANPSTPAPAGL